MQSAAEFLQERGIRPSVQRTAVYAYLRDHMTHPTAEEIYLALAPEFATLSRATVYNTLRLFAEKGAAKLITIEEKEMRFDSLTTIHGHFKCVRCGCIEDFPIDEAAVRRQLPAGDAAEEFHFYVRGTCARCRAENPKKAC